MRLIDELRACGVFCARVSNGKPLIESGSQKIADLVWKAHVPSDDEYLTKDLTVHAAALMKALGPESDEWAAYCTIQCDMIRARRAEAYVAPGGPNLVFLEMASDGDTFTNAKAAAVAAKAEIKKKIAFPGEYR